MKRMLPVLAAVAAALLLLAIACDDDGVGPLPSEMPADFGVVSRFSNGAVSPPYDYSYQINASAAAGDDAILFLPDDLVFSGFFTASPAGLSDLYDLAYRRALLRNAWTLRSDPPAGASSRSVRITADGRDFEIPVGVVETTGLDSFYAAIDSLVPDAIWDGFHARRDSLINARI